MSILGQVLIKQQRQWNSIAWHSLWHMLCLILASVFVIIIIINLCDGI
jgi:hypothetical protein